MSVAPKVLYIAGMGRSGSTLLDLVLGEVEGFVSGGEINLYWQVSEVAGWPCTCGAELADCEMWGGIASRLQAAGGAIDSAEMRRVYHAYLRSKPRQLAALLRASRGGARSAPLRRYADATTELYAHLAERGRARVVVDSSKLPHVAHVLERFSALELYVVHLIRDPRGVAFAASGRRPEQEGSRGSTWPVPRLDPVSSSAGWLLRNAFIDASLRPRLGPRFMRLRYEDFVADPRGSVETIAAFVGEPEARTSFTGPSAATVSDSHLVSVPYGDHPAPSGASSATAGERAGSGNPRRFSPGEITIMPDLEWRARMPARTRITTTLCALPLMPRYGYPIRARAASP